MAAALDPANFDPVRIKALIAESTLNDSVKAALNAAVDGAAQSPMLIEAAVNQVRAALAPQN